MDYLLEYKGFRASAGHLLNNLMEDKDFIDVTLACEENQQIKAHKVVLSSSSPVFKNILVNNPHKNPIIYLTDVKFNELRLILQFMYLGKTKVLRDDLDKFLAAANKLKISGLADLNQDRSNIANLSSGNEGSSSTKEKPARIPANDPIATSSKATTEESVPNLKKEIFEEQSKGDDYQRNNDQENHGLVNNENSMDSTKGKEMLAVFDGILTDKDNEDSQTSTSSSVGGESSKMDDDDDGSKEQDLYEAISSNIKKQLEDRKKFPCDHCGYAATQKGNLTQHKKRMHGVESTPMKNPGPTPFKKPLPPGSEENATPWKTPRRGRSTESLEPMTWKKAGEETPSKSGLQCEQCSYKASSKQTLKVHVDAKHEGKKFECKFCEYKSSYRSGVYIHEKKSHSAST